MFPLAFLATGTSRFGLNLALIRSVGVACHPIVPVALAAVECVEVDLLTDTLGETRARILPEHPITPRINLRRMRCHGAQPERVVLERTLQVVLVEVARRIDDRLLA